MNAAEFKDIFTSIGHSSLSLFHYSLLWWQITDLCTLFLLYPLCIETYRLVFKYIQQLGLHGLHYGEHMLGVHNK